MVQAQSDSIQTKGETLEFVHLFNARPQDEISCYRIPARVTAPNGDLIAAIKDGDDKNRLLFSNATAKNDRINLTLRISYNEGETGQRGKLFT